MMWMPERSVRMKRFTFGFQRRVWCPKWTPLSSSWRMVTTAMVVSLYQGTPLACRLRLRCQRALASLVSDTHPPSSEGPLGEMSGRGRMDTRSHPDERDASLTIQHPGARNASFSVPTGADSRGFLHNR